MAQHEWNGANTIAQMISTQVYLKIKIKKKRCLDQLVQEKAQKFYYDSSKACLLHCNWW